MATEVRRNRRSTRMPSRRSPGHFIEQLEKRACPAAVAITGPAEIDETAGTAQIVVALTERSSAPVTVSYSIQSTLATATYGRDYRLFTGRSQVSPTGTLTFRAGQTSQVITMQVLDDTLREGNESFTFSLQQARGATLNPAARSLTVTIKDNDAYTASIVGPATVPPGVTVEYSLQLSSPATKRETFLVSTRDGTARVTEDYRPLTRVPVTILPGQSSALVRLVTLPNIGPDYDRIVFLDVVPTDPKYLPAPTPFPVTIPGELGPLPPSISISDVTVTEGAAGTTKTASFLVTLSTPFPNSVSVDYTTTDGTATAANNDYVATSGTLVFAPGEMSKAISVTVVGDNTGEPDESFQVFLSSSVNAFVARASGTGLIINDDAPPTPPYQITVTFPDNTLTAAQKAVFLTAANRWSQIIVGDLPDVTYQGKVIDDLEIVATAPAIDGVGGILGQAGPRNFRSASGLPFLGQMQFDSADVASLMADGSFANVIIHEMGHVIGIGTIWDSFVQNLNTNDPIFVGANAVREYKVLAGNDKTSVPVENVGGPGTRGGHWRESVFDNELMTGYLNRGVNPLSKVTVGALQDLGYSVNYAAADAYTLNARQAAINFQLAQLPGAPGNRLFLVGSQPAANLFAGVAFAAGMDQLINDTVGSVATKTFRALGALRG